jgi:hypothetical protein
MRKRFLPSVSVLWGGEGVEGADGTPLRVVGEGAHHLLVPAAVAAAQEKESRGSNPNVGAGEGCLSNVISAAGS